MPRRFFRKFAFNRQQLTDKPFVAPFRHLLQDQRLWGIRRKTVVPALAWGVFVGFLPIPGQVLLAVLGSVLMRCNVPVAALATFVSNPLTIGPMFFFSYRVGAELLSWPVLPFSIELSIEWLRSTFASVWQPLVLGSVFVGAMAALLAFLILDALWRFSIADYKTRKRNRRTN